MNTYALLSLEIIVNEIAVTRFRDRAGILDGAQKTEIAGKTGLQSAEADYSKTGVTGKALPELPIFKTGETAGTR